MRFVSVAWVLPLLLFGQSAEAARISFASSNCGTPPLLGLQFSIDAFGEPVGTTACPQPSTFEGVAGDLVDDTNQSALYGEQITDLALTIVSDQNLIDFPFEVGDFYGESSLSFSFDFTAFDEGGGGVLSIQFTNPIELSCGPGDTRFGRVCAPLDLLIFVDGSDDNRLQAGTTLQVTAVNGVPVPEPTTLALLVAGMGAAAVRRRRTTAKK